MTRGQFLALIVPLVAVVVGGMVVWAVEESGVAGPPWDEHFARHVRESMANEFVWGVGSERKQWEANFNALNAYVQTYDAYAEVTPPWRVAQIREDSSGQYTGVGLRTEPPPEGEPFDHVTITGVKPDGPADKAGVRVGDAIIGVDSASVLELCPEGDQTPLQNTIRGMPGTDVRLLLRGPDGKEREASVTRAQIDSGSVFGVRFADQPRKIGYIRVDQFQASTARDFKKELSELIEKDITALILDLRYNGGGLMDQAVQIADYFLPSGVILHQRGRSGQYTATYTATSEGTISGALPLAVLVNRNSASASEILAGALQDHRRAVLVGERTYGKFLVQMVEEVPMELGNALFKRTTSIYETPSGHHYQRAPGGEPDPLAGIVPDVYVPTTKTQRAQLYRVFLDEYYADWNPDRDPAVKDHHDAQLAAAVAALRGETYYPAIVAE